VRADLLVYAAITSTNGDISLMSQDGLTQAAAGDISAQALGATVEVQTQSTITMTDGAQTHSHDGVIRYEAANGNITVSEMDAGAGAVAVLAQRGSILDIQADSAGVDIVASDVLLNAGDGIASSANALEVSANRLSTLSKISGTFITAFGSVTVDAVSVTGRRVELAGTSRSLSTQTQEDMRSAKLLVLSTLDGAITVEGGTDDVGVQAVLGITLQSREIAEATAADITLHAGVKSQSGRVMLSSADSVVLPVAASDITAASVSLTAAGGVFMADGALISTQHHHEHGHLEHQWSGSRSGPRHQRGGHLGGQGGHQDGWSYWRGAQPHRSCRHAGCGQIAHQQDVHHSADPNACTNRAGASQQRCEQAADVCASPAGLCQLEPWVLVG